MACLVIAASLGTGLSSSAPARDAYLSGRNVAVTPRVAGADSCRQLRKAVRYYRAAYVGWRSKVGAGVEPSGLRRSTPCSRYLAKLLRSKARAARISYERWRHYHFAWWDWMPDKWARIGACETGYGRRPGQWTWNSGQYQGAFGFAVSSWDSFRLPGYPSEAWQATPRQQYEVALAIWRRYGFSGWGCRDA